MITCKKCRYFKDSRVWDQLSKNCDQCENGSEYRLIPKTNLEHFQTLPIEEFAETRINIYNGCYVCDAGVFPIKHGEENAMINARKEAIKGEIEWLKHINKDS